MSMDWASLPSGPATLTTGTQLLHKKAWRLLTLSAARPILPSCPTQLAAPQLLKEIVRQEFSVVIRPAIQSWSVIKMQIPAFKCDFLYTYVEKEFSSTGIFPLPLEPSSHSSRYLIRTQRPCIRAYRIVHQIDFDNRSEWKNISRFQCDFWKVCFTFTQQCWLGVHLRSVINPYLPVSSATVKIDCFSNGITHLKVFPWYMK